MLTKEQQDQFHDIFEELGKSLDITETQFNNAVTSYRAVGEQLSKKDSLLAPYDPEILPQGSFLLGTMIKPVIETDELDVDLVCQLSGKVPSWAQYDVKQKVGDQLKANKIYKKMLDEEGRRCWTLLYADDSKYHMDILPAIVDSGYRLILESVYASREAGEWNKLAIRITDKERPDFFTERNHLLWLKSNPFGYGYWFFGRATLDSIKAYSLNESIKPLPSYQKNRLPLQRVVQILKRHRDMMFNGDDDKPISIIITTLAARAYNKETNILLALSNVIDAMPRYIENRICGVTGNTIKWIANPVNDEENFADKWVETPRKEKNFYKWLDAVKLDLQKVLRQKSSGIHMIGESLSASFGERDVKVALKAYGDKQLELREGGLLSMAEATGTIGLIGRAKIPKHTNYGA